MNNIYLKTDLGILDILSSLSPIGGFNQVKARAITMTLLGHDCKVVSVEDLIRIKETMPRPKDKEAVLHLQEILKRNKDGSHV